MNILKVKIINGLNTEMFGFLSCNKSPEVVNPEHDWSSSSSNIKDQIFLSFCFTTPSSSSPEDPGWCWSSSHHIHKQKAEKA